MHHWLVCHLVSSPLVSPVSFLAGVRTWVPEEAWGVPVGSGMLAPGQRLTGSVWMCQRYCS